jgi:predicted transcriptional regulator
MNSNFPSQKGDCIFTLHQQKFYIKASRIYGSVQLHMVGIMVVQSQIIDIVKNKKLEPDFEPSMKTLLRIMRTMTKNGPEAKTSLSLDTNLNYARLAKHIVWLEKKGLVESTIDKTKINVGLTKKGRVFASTLSDD